MEGTVYIYGTDKDGNRELLYEESNLTTVGFAEQIVDMLTLPSAIGSVTDPTTAANFLDSSNYTIQGLSFSKPKEHFKQNQHTYTTKNLLYWTDFSNIASGVLPTSANPWYLAEGELEVNSVPGPIFGVSGSRLVKNSGNAAEVLTYELGLSSQNQDFGLDKGDYTIPTYNNNDGSGYYFSGTDFTFSIDMKVDEDYLPNVENGNYISELQIVNMSSTLVSSMAISWDSSGNASVYEVEDEAPDGRSSHGGLKSLGGGWFRVFLNSYCDISQVITDSGAGPLHTSSIKVIVSPCAITDELAQNDDATTTAGAIYISRPQLELGRVPTNFVTNNISGTLDDLDRFSLLNDSTDYSYADLNPVLKSFNYFWTSGNNGLSYSGLYGGVDGHIGASAYIPPKTPVVPAANPHDRVLTEGARTPVEEALDIEFVQGQIPAVLRLGDDIMLSSYNTEWSYTSAYTPNLGRHVGYLGAFSTKQDTFVDSVLVSALSEEGYKNPLDKRTLRNGFDGQAGATLQVDRFGYIPIHDNGENDINPHTGASVFWVSAAGDFSSTGEVSYNFRFQNGNSTLNRDAVSLNLFGGVSLLGLWGLDLRAIRSDSPSSFPPYSGAAQDSSVTPVRKYKLMSKKVLTDSIVRNEGEAGAGLGGYEFDNNNITIRWVLKFL